MDLSEVRQQSSAYQSRLEQFETVEHWTRTILIGTALGFLLKMCTADGLSFLPSLRE